MLRYPRLEQDIAVRVVERAQGLEGKTLEAAGNAIQVLGRAIVLQTPFVEGYGETHITISYFPKGVPDTALRCAKMVWEA